MPTLHDLHDAFGELADGAPTRLHDPIVAPHRHRLLAAGIAAACTAAVAVAVPLAVSGNHHSPSTRTSSSSPAANHGPVVAARFDAALPAPAAGQSPVLAYGFDTAGGSGVVRPDEVTRTYQHAMILDGDTQTGDLYLFYAGAFDPSSAENGTPVDVDGQPGYFTTLTPPEHSQAVPALAWKYADDGWGVITMSEAGTAGATAAKGAEARAHAQREFAATARDRAYEVELAAHTSQAHVAQLSPVGLPANSGYYVDSLASGQPDGGLVLDSADAAHGAWYLGWSPFTLTPSDKPDTSTVQVGGHEWIVYLHNGAPDSLGLVADGWGMTVTAGGSTTLDALEQFVAALRLPSDPADSGNWFDAATALP